MTRTQIASLMVLMVAVPAAAGAYFTPAVKPCFVAGSAAYRVSDTGAGNVTVRVDNAAARPNLRMQIVDDPAAADFVLVDDGDAGSACQGAVETIRIDNKAGSPDLTVALSRNAADYKIYVRSERFSAQDAAALFAVMWRDARGTGFIAARD
jgi:hypothetical protein